ncbi:PTS system cellobiose-specific IIB component [Olsenella profusa DSM 13989]|uniref:PTS system, lactose/cellobiose-specific IIB subunit n=1 Tax=Olsenella profusa F0195 TaxID=1125712 RepID=U2T6F0_9ACTN|nr:PTS sugar transporter subunit IIB [Olsenella profusa]ERL08639.1 PTS system, lactose/cellobiose-specific IIB subunit [Olsenella profusa F0195]MDP9860001.1 PTS system cellobiose-specific IIB component [Olsenella profusa DSM 13989]
MKVLLVCAGGMSTSILMKKLEKYAASKGIDFEVAAVGLSAYKDKWQDYDVLLMGPQVGYQKDDVTKSVSIPVGVIPPADYGIGNCEHIFAQLDKLLGK